jgi:hypothetical protein
VKRELDQPPEIAGDENATEMIRVWIAHNQPHRWHSVMAGTP